MAYAGQISRRQRAVSWGGAAVVVTVIGLLLVNGLNPSIVRHASEAISALSIPLPPPPRELVAPSPQSNDAASGKAAAANETAKAVAIVAPESPIPRPRPPITTAPRPDAGDAASAGATPDPGPGTGAGGRGDGIGAGGSGQGTGGGTRPQWLSGAIRDRDYPRDASHARIGGEVEVRFTVEPNGRAARCRVTRSSGDASLDRTTCALIEARFRFIPATDASGQPIASPYGWRQSWWLEPRR